MSHFDPKQKSESRALVRCGGAARPELRTLVFENPCLYRSTKLSGMDSFRRQMVNLLTLGENRC
jgi:hypothetical protein